MAEVYEGLYVSFGANTIEFDNSIKGMNKALTGLRKDFSTINRQLKFDPTNTDLLQRKFNNLQQQAEISTKKIAQLREEQKALGDEKIGTAEWNKFELEIASVESKLNSIVKASENVKNQLDDMSDPNSVYNLNKSLDNTESQLDLINQRMQLNPNNIDLLNKKYKLLDNQIATNTRKLDVLREKQAKLDDSDLGKQEWIELEQQIIDTENAIKNYNKEKKNAGKTSFSDSLNASSLNQMGQGITSVGNSLMPLTAGLTLAGGVSIKFASDMEESLNKVEVSFGKYDKDVKDFAKTSITQFGVTEASALEMASTFGDMGTSMGISQKEASVMSTNLVGLAGDLSSFKNIGIDEAVTALNGVFTGETESLKRLGVVMTETNLTDFAKKQGLVYKEMSQAEKVALRYNYVLEMTKNAQGDYARTSEGFANSTRTAKGLLEQIATTLGNILLPVVTNVLQIVNDVLTFILNLPEGAKQVIIVIGTLIAILGPLLVIVGNVMSFIASVQIALPLITTALSGVGLSLSALVPIIVGVIAVISGLILLILNWDEVIMFVRKSINDLSIAIKERFSFIKTFISAIINTIINLFSWMVGSIISLWKNWVETIINIASGIIEKITNIFKNIPKFIKEAINKDSLIEIGKFIIESIIKGTTGFGSMLVDEFKKGIANAKSDIGNIKEQTFGKSYGLSNINNLLNDVQGLNFSGVGAYKGYGQTINNTGGNSINISVSTSSSNPLELVRVLEKHLVRSLNL